MDLWIRTNSSNNSGLICGNASDDTEATYVFYSKVYRWGSYYINQYVGIPFATMSPYQWYGVYVFEYDDEHDAWKKPDDGDLKPFTAYDIISRSSETNYTTFYTDGVLNLPGTSGTKTLTCTGETRYDAEGTLGEREISYLRTVGQRPFMLELLNLQTIPISPHRYISSMRAMFLKAKMKKY